MSKVGKTRGIIWFIDPSVINWTLGPATDWEPLDSELLLIKFTAGLGSDKVKL